MSAPFVVLKKIPKNNPSVILGPSSSIDLFPKKSARMPMPARNTVSLPTTKQSASASIPFPNQQSNVLTKQVQKIKSIDADKNLPDIGNSFVEPYNDFEKAIQRIEEANAFVDNLAFGSNLIQKVAPSTKLARFLQPISKLGTSSKHVNAALYTTDATRALVDPEYRQKIDEGIERSFDNMSGNTNAFLTSLRNGAQRPISHTAGLLRMYQKNKAAIEDNDKKSQNASNEIERKKMEYKNRITPMGSSNIGTTGVDFSIMPSSQYDIPLWER